uniref:Uncharacterized protein n=1 Tax=Anguilla anguilla TaxID=7936 RepID=A0A0E9PNF0_ANGAN
MRCCMSGVHILWPCSVLGKLIIYILCAPDCMSIENVMELDSET